MTEQDILNMAVNMAIETNRKIAQKKIADIGYHDLYKESCEMSDAISIHAVKGVFPEKLFKHRSPNETQKEADYIRNNYKQHTLPVFIDYLSTITRPFGDGNWSIDYEEDQEVFKTANKKFQDYVEGELPIYNSLENFIKFILPTIKTIDANGYLTVRPKDVEYITNEEGVAVIDGDKLYEPTIFYFDSKNVIDYGKEYYLFLSKEKSTVSYNGKKQKSGTILELYTKDSIFFISQHGLKSDNLFEVKEFYKHDLNAFPVHQLMGIPSLSGDEILWQSPFLYSVDILDLVAMNANWLQASINKCVFPIPVMFGSPCLFRDAGGNECREGMIHVDGSPHHECPSCHGQGLTSRLSALGTFFINPSTKFEVGETDAKQDPLKFISPDVSTLEFISNKVEQDTEKARRILHIQTSNSNVKGSTELTATGVAIDAKAMHAFIKPISDQIFTLYEFCLKFIGFQRYGEKFLAPKMSYPKTFDFKTPEDYLKDIADATANSLPPSFIQTILMQYINSFYGDNANTINIFKIIVSADRLFGISQDEINMQLARGTVAKWEQVLHTSILKFVSDSIQEDDTFLNKVLTDQVNVLQELAKKIESEISSDITASSIYNV